MTQIDDQNSDYNQDHDADGNQALWGGRFEDAPSQFMQEFGASLPVDWRLWEQDIAGSTAHANMLASQGIISSADAHAIVQGLEDIAVDIDAGELEFDIASEDIHMAIETELTNRIGEAGKRLHTGRSRNDQVVTDFRLYCKQEAEFLALLTMKLKATIFIKAKEHQNLILPGYTHLQRAQPVLFAQHLLAWYAMFERDVRRLLQASDAADASPLGAAALAGTAYPIDRQQTADELEFSRVIPNSMDAVSDRDFALDLLYAASVTMMHLSRICEELILWSSEEFGFVMMSDTFSTGSSIMPQKKNPDFAELTRGKTGRVYGNLIALLTTLKGLPLAYNKDLQEDKEGTIDSIETLTNCLEAVNGMIATMTINSESMHRAAAGGLMAATDLADYLVKKGLAFRDAHEIIGHLVLFAQKTGRGLEQLTLQELQEFSPKFAKDALTVIKVENLVAAKTSFGGTSPQSVAEQLKQIEQSLGLDEYYNEFEDSDEHAHHVHDDQGNCIH